MCFIIRRLYCDRTYVLVYDLMDHRRTARVLQIVAPNVFVNSAPPVAPVKRIGKEAATGAGITRTFEANFRGTSRIEKPIEEFKSVTYLGNFRKLSVWI